MAKTKITPTTTYNVHNYMVTDSISASINNRVIKAKRADRILLSQFEADILKPYVIRLNEEEQ